MPVLVVLTFYCGKQRVQLCYTVINSKAGTVKAGKGDYEVWENQNFRGVCWLPNGPQWSSLVFTPFSSLLYAKSQSWFVWSVDYGRGDSVCLPRLGHEGIVPWSHGCFLWNKPTTISLGCWEELRLLPTAGTFLPCEWTALEINPPPRLSLRGLQAPLTSWLPPH